MGKGKGNNGGNRGARESGHKDDLDEIFSRGQKEKKGSRFRENNEDNELAAFSESLERFNPAQAIEKAGEEVTEAGSLALQETQELMPEGATPAQEAIVEGFDEQINAAQIDAQEALKRLNQERIEDEQRQQLSDQYLDAFADALRVEIQDKDMSSQEVVFDVYHRALGKARERVDISDELEIGLHSRIMKILEGIQDESSSGIDDEDYESSDKDQELDQPQAGINDFSALAGLRDKLPEKPEPPSNPESKLPYDKLNQEERKIRLVSFLRSFATTLQDAFEQKALVSDEQIRDVIIDSLHSVKNDSKLSMQAEKRLIRYLALIVQDIRNGENVSKLDFEDMIEQLPERTDEKSDKYIDYSPRERAFVDEIFDFSKTLVSNSDNHKKRQVTKSEQLPKSKNPFKAFEKVFADRLRLELRGMSSDTTEESLDATYRRVLDAVFENFNAELPKYETATLLGQKNSF
jgi:hypothetical protein